MKKLIKTAKQQFEERLSELQNPVIEKIRDTTYYSCDDQDGRFIVLSKYEGNYEAYSEIVYGYSLMDIYTDADFLASLTEFWIEYRHEPLKVLFEWYATADKDNPPFGVDDILQCYGKGSHISFGDKYEEVPDVQIVSAREQFEHRLEEVGLLQAWYDQCSFGRIGTIDKETKRILVFVHEDYSDGYTEFVYPPFEELRKDSGFCLECLGELVDNCDDTFFKAVSLWIHKGGNCPLDPVDAYFPANHLRLEETTDFEDKIISQEQPTIEQLLALTTEQQEAVKMIDEGYRLLKERGGEIICYPDDNDFFAFNANGVEYESDNWGYESYKKAGYIDVSDCILAQRFKFGFYHWAIDGCVFAKPKN